MSQLDGDGEVEALTVHCAVCCRLHEHPFPNLYTDEDGVPLDACRGVCARAAGYA